MKHPRANRLVMGAVLVLSLTSAPMAGSGQSPAPAARDAAQSQDDPAQRELYWRARAEAARKRLAAAEAELKRANGEVSRMRRRNHPRGDPRAALFARRKAARAEYEAAVRAFEVELPREAEEARADPDWLSD